MMKSKLFCFITIALVMSTMEVQGRLSGEQREQISAIIDELFDAAKQLNKPEKFSKYWYEEALKKWETGYRVQK